MENIKYMKKIGMVGFGHLGSSIAESLIKGGIDRSSLLISYSGRKETAQKISYMGLDSCITGTQSVMKYSDIIFLAARPQDIKDIAKYQVRKDSLLLSFMAALPHTALGSYFDCNISRVMCSGPETISGGRGVSVLYNGNSSAKELLRFCGIKEMHIKTESEIDAFTAGICIPPILKNIAIDEQERKRALMDMSFIYPVFHELSAWIETELALSLSENAPKSLENVSTKGGISEAIVANLTKGTSFLSAVKKGIERCAEIREDMCKNLLISAA